MVTEKADAPDKAAPKEESAFEAACRRAVEETERRGGWVPRDPKIKKRPPRKPSWSW